MNPGLLSSASRGAVSAQAQGPSTDTSTVSRSVASIANDGSASCASTLVARDTEGAYIAGATAVMSVSPATGNTVTQPSPATTNAYGEATGSFVSTEAEVKTISWTVGGRAVPATVTCEVTGAAAAPTITSVLPATGTTAGGTQITLTGTGFQGGAQVTVGGHACTSENVLSDTSMTAVAPAHAAEAGLDVVVTNTDTQTGTKAAAFAFEVPAEEYATPDLVNNASFEAGWDNFTGASGVGDPSATAPRTIARATDQAYAGSYSAKLTWAANSGDSTGYFKKYFASTYDELWARIYFRLADGWELTSTNKFWVFRKTDGYILGGFNFNSVGGFIQGALGGLSWSFLNEAGGVAANIVPAASISADAWHSLEIHLRRNGDTYPNAEFWFDGTQVTKADGDDPADTRLHWASGVLSTTNRITSDKVQQAYLFETTNATNTGSGTIWFDRIAYSTAGRIGP